MTALQITQQYEIALDPSPSFPFDAISAMAFHEPGDLIVPGYESGSVSIVRKSSRSIVRTLPTTSSEKTPVKAIAISPDGKCLAISGSHHTIALWDLPSLTQRGRYYGHRAGMWGRQGMVTSLSWAPDCLLLTIEETAEILHLSRSAVYELIKHEGLPSFTIGGSRRIHPEELEQWINQRKRPG